MSTAEIREAFEAHRRELDERFTKLISAAWYNPHDDLKDHPTIAFDMVFDEIAMLRTELKAVTDVLSGRGKP